MRSAFIYLASICLMLFGSSMMPSYALAVSESAISITATPENGAPGEEILVTVNSYVINLDAVNITWFINGKKISSGIGQKSTTFTIPLNSSDTTIRATLSLSDGPTDRTIIIRPSTMILLYEATDAYVPPFYRGKALPSIGSDIKIIALPEIKSKGAILNSKNMIYDWTRNYTNDAGSSGYGKNSLTYTNDFLEDSETIGVTVSTTDGQSSVKGSITVVPSDIQISLYKYDKLLGTLWERALINGYKINGEEVIVAEPYFITPKEIQTPRLVWNWFINDGLVNVLGKYRRNMLPLKVESGVSGTSKLRLEIENKDNFLETAQKEITVEF